TSYLDRPVEDWISSRAILEAYFDSAGARVHEAEDGAGTADGREVGGQVIGVKEVAELARGGSTEAKQALVNAFAALADALAPWLERFGATRVVLGGSISGAFDVVQEVFDFDVTVTADTEHSALIGAAARFVAEN
ncbi:MAG TPA: ROK family protein, partial [Kribbella sp.]|nr:ROK family protein [Kribbella sp.]